MKGFKEGRKRNGRPSWSLFYLSLFLPSSPLFSQEKRNPFLPIRPTVQSHPRVPKREGQKIRRHPNLFPTYGSFDAYRNCVTLFFSDLYEGDESRSPIRPYWNHTFFCRPPRGGKEKSVPGNNGARTGKNDFYFPGINFWCWRKKRTYGN